jgi:Flp pilus assembly pilin Flp
MAIETRRHPLKAFRADVSGSVVMQYAILVAATALLTALAMRAYGTDVAARFETISAVLRNMSSGRL